jgi:single-stranded-DNA-specific exonuclease
MPDNEPLIIDAELPRAYIAPDIFSVADCFEPYGAGNEPLIFSSKGLKVIAAALMGKNEPKHLKLTVDAGKYQWPAVMRNAQTEVKAGDTVDIAYSFERDCYRKIGTPQIIVKDIRIHSP